MVREYITGSAFFKTQNDMYCPICKKVGVSVTDGSMFFLRCDRCDRTFEIRLQSMRKPNKRVKRLKKSESDRIKIPNEFLDAFSSSGGKQ